MVVVVLSDDHVNSGVHVYYYYFFLFIIFVVFCTIRGIKVQYSD
jgi:hypothetical protein